MAEPTEEERQAFLDMWAKAKADHEKDQPKVEVQFIPYYVYPNSPCPHCGYCPHCGRGGGHFVSPGIGYLPSITWKRYETGYTVTLTGNATPLWHQNS